MKVKAGMKRLTASIIRPTAALSCPARAARPAVRSPSTSRASPAHTARKMIWRELPSRKGAKRLPGTMPSSMA